MMGGPKTTPDQAAGPGEAGEGAGPASLVLTICIYFHKQGPELQDPVLKPHSVARHLIGHGDWTFPTPQARRSCRLLLGLQQTQGRAQVLRVPRACTARIAGEPEVCDAGAGR